MINKSRYVSFNNPTVFAVGTIDQKIISYEADRYLLLQGFDLNYISDNAPFVIGTDNPILHCWQKIIIDGSNIYEKNRQPPETGVSLTQYYPFPNSTIFIDTVLGTQRMFANHYHFVAGGIALIEPGNKVEVYVSNTMTTATFVMNYTLFLQEVLKCEIDEVKKAWGLR